MELSKFAEEIKNELAIELAKEGMSLFEFEEALASINNGESVYKVAFVANNMFDNVSKTMGAASGPVDFALKSSLAGGALAGYSLDEMDKSVDGLNKSLAREREKINLIKRITQNLRKEHGI